MAREGIGRWLLAYINRDSRDDFATGVKDSNFLDCLEAKREVRTATGNPSSPNGGRGADLAIFLAFGGEVWAENNLQALRIF